MTFIRAPYIEEAAPGVKVLAAVGGRTAAVEYRSQLAMSFHPELDKDRRIYRYFIEQICRQESVRGSCLTE